MSWNPRTNRPARAKPANKFASIKSGVREDIGPMFFRSSWEANYARYLNFLIKHGQIEKWEHEPDTFWFEAIRRGTRSYLPDFKVWENGKIHYVEVKGYMDAKSKTKLKRMAKYYPDIDLRLVGAREYRSIAVKVGRMVSGWE